MRRNSEERERLRDRCAYLYVTGKNQNEIADLLGLKRSMVQRFLKDAEDKKIIELKLNLPSIRKLEVELTAKFGLRDARVCRAAQEHQVYENGVVPNGQDIAALTARFFESVALNGMRVGLAGADLMRKVVGYLQQDRFEGLEIYAISAGVGSRISSNAVVGAMASRYRDGKSHELQVPAFVSRNIPLNQVDEEKRRLLSDSKSDRNFEDAHNVHILMTGIGSPEISSVRDIMEALGISKIDGAVGDINYQVFDKEGILMNCELNRRVVAVSLEHIREMTADREKYVIGAASARKHDAIKAALKGRLLNVLITDEQVAIELLKQGG